MTKEETQKILAVIKAAYPAFYKDSTKSDIAVAINLWHDMLIDESCQNVIPAVKSIIKTSKFAPSIAEVLEQIHKDKETGFHKELEKLTRKK